MHGNSISITLFDGRQCSSSRRTSKDRSSLTVRLPPLTILPNIELYAAVMGKVEEDPDYVKLLGTDKYLPWHGHVTCLTVAPQYRQMGLAKTLTAHLDQACEHENAWFMDLFVRVSNKTAINMYKGMGCVRRHLGSLVGILTSYSLGLSYSVYRRVVDYYSDDPTGHGTSEDAFDMRKSLSRDKTNRYIRVGGEDYRIHPEDIYHP